MHHSVHTSSNTVAERVLHDFLATVAQQSDLALKGSATHPSGPDVTITRLVLDNAKTVSSNPKAITFNLLQGYVPAVQENHFLLKLDVFKRLRGPAAFIQHADKVRNPNQIQWLEPDQVELTEAHVGGLNHIKKLFCSNIDSKQRKQLLYSGESSDDVYACLQYLVESDYYDQHALTGSALKLMLHSMKAPSDWTEQAEQVFKQIYVDVMSIGLLAQTYGNKAAIEFARYALRQKNNSGHSYFYSEYPGVNYSCPAIKTMLNTIAPDTEMGLEAEDSVVFENMSLSELRTYAIHAAVDNITMILWNNPKQEFFMPYFQNGVGAMAQVASDLHFMVNETQTCVNQLKQGQVYEPSVQLPQLNNWEQYSLEIVARHKEQVTPKSKKPKMS